MMELMTAVNRMLHKSSSCRRRRLGVRCYSVVPLDQECGLIEWVPHMLQVRAVPYEVRRIGDLCDPRQRPN